MFSYKAHGLIIHSEINFPELEKTNSKPQIEIKWGKIDSSSKEIISEGVFRVASHYKLSPDSVYLIWNDIEICEIITGNKIIVNHYTNIEDSFLRALILGPALGILMHQRGRLVLHASAVQMKDGVVAFMGHNGMGKSTTTMTFYQQDYPLVADDILSIEFDDNGNPYVFPGFPRIKLWSETIQLFEKDVEKYPLINSKSDKRSYFVNNFSKNIMPLKRVYIIENDEKTSLEPINPHNALIELLRNSYSANIFQKTDQATNLGNYGQIVKNVPIKTLTVIRSLNKLSEIIEVVEKDLA